MVKRITGLLMLLTCVFAVSAQQEQQIQRLPLNPKVRHGVLPNGLTYYVMHNEEPKGRANFYIAQKVGSTLETPRQLGLAHFLEHMAFNGSKNFPGNTMLEYLQKKGIRFGNDINAYTGFDETVYNIENIPCNDQALMDSTLLILHDWSCDLLLENEEIDKERGVIEEEWRSRNNADTRMYTAILPQLYKEYQYTQMPIGSMDIVRNFPYQDLRDYYEKWYRPDQQGIIVVGDFDAEAMEAKIKEIFSPIEMPENPAERTYAAVSDNEAPIYIAFEDPELTRSMIQVSIKYNKVPVEFRSTVPAYVDDVCKNLIATMINNRLDELAQNPDCKFANAGVYFGDYYISKTKGAFNIQVLAKDQIVPAFDEAFAEVVRACKTGFTDSELARAKQTLSASYEKAYNERSKAKSGTLAQELIRNFTEGEAAPGIEIEWNLVQQIMPVISVQSLNQSVAQIITPTNQVILVNQPQAEGKVLPTEQEVLTTMADVMNRKYEAYVDEVITDPLIAQMPTPGTIVSTKELAQFGATEYTLSNGAHVYIKPTDYAADNISFIAFRKSGKNAFGGEYAAELNAMPLALEVSKLADFDNVKLSKKLAGTNLSSSAFISTYGSGFSGNTSVKDLETLMQILYLQFTDIRPDAEKFQAGKSQMIPMMERREKDPQQVFMRNVTETWYGNNPYAARLSSEQLKAADYDKILSMAKDMTANAANYDFIFVGNIDAKTFIPLMEQYIASLPGNPKTADKKKYSFKIKQAQGQKENFFTLPMESPQVMVFNNFSGKNVPYNLRNSIMTELVGDVLEIVYTRTLREEEGGTYSPSAAGALNPNTGEWSLYYMYFTGEEAKDKLYKRAYDELVKLLNEGATEEDFNKVKGAAKAQNDINSKGNAYWTNKLYSYLIDGVDTANPYDATLDAITLQDFNKFMKKLYNNKNRVQVVLDGEKVEK